MKRTLIAVALLSVLATGAYAGEDCGSGCGPATLHTSTKLNTDIKEDGHVTLRGSVEVKNSAGATVNNQQTADLNESQMSIPTTLSANIGGDALSRATGNIGVNISAGINNVQSNTVALANMSAGPVLGSAQIFSTQKAEGTGILTYDPLNIGSSANLSASVGDGALAGATGNVGVNVASGMGNVQNNSLALSATTDGGKGAGGEVIASDQNCQTAQSSVYAEFSGTASLGAGALVGATGNIGVNITTGVGNLQHNGLAIASANR